MRGESGEIAGKVYGERGPGVKRLPALTACLPGDMYAREEYMCDKRKYIAEQARIFKALGHPSRLLMVDALRQRELCVGELQALVGHDMSTVSKHLSILRDAGIVSARRQGASMRYRLTLCCLDAFLSCTGELLHRRIHAQMDVLAGR